MYLTIVGPVWNGNFYGHDISLIAYAPYAQTAGDKQAEGAWLHAMGVCKTVKIARVNRVKITIKTIFPQSARKKSFP